MKRHEQLRQEGFIRVVDDTGPEEGAFRRKAFEIRRLNEQTYVAIVETRTRKVRASRVVTRAELENLLSSMTNAETFDIDWFPGADTLGAWEFREHDSTLNVSLSVPTYFYGRFGGDPKFLIRVTAHFDQWSVLIDNLKEELR